MKFLFAITWFAAIFLLCTVMLVGKSQWDSHAEALARKTEAEFNLPHGIAHAFCLQENSGRLDSAKSRIEPSYYNEGARHYQEVLVTSRAFIGAFLDYGLPLDAERAQESSSWGPFQVTGLNLRRLGCTAKYLANLTVEEHFYWWGKLFRQEFLNRYKTLARAVKMYNGPAAKPSYTRNVLRYRERFSY